MYTASDEFDTAGLAMETINAEEAARAKAEMLAERTIQRAIDEDNRLLELEGI